MRREIRQAVARLLVIRLPAPRIQMQNRRLEAGPLIIPAAVAPLPREAGTIMQTKAETRCQKPPSNLRRKPCKRDCRSSLSGLKGTVQIITPCALSGAVARRAQVFSALDAMILACAS